jgi:hypothetical protein
MVTDSGYQRFINYTGKLFDFQGGRNFQGGSRFINSALHNLLMYFSVEPKTRKKDLFDFDKEYEVLNECIESGEERIIVVSGLRRTGKTSLMKVIYNEINQPKLYIDSREIYPLTPSSVNQHFITALMDFVKEHNLIKAVLDHVKAIELMVRIEAKERENILSAILKTVNVEMEKRKTHTTIFIDEAQILKPTGFDRMIAYIYDNLKHIQVVIAGSEIGLLEEFVGKEKDAPLYGRARKLITLNRLASEKSILFLRQGFKQAGKKISEEELNKIVNEIDGIIGWLAMYGWYSLRMDSKKALNTVLKEGSKIVAGELDAFLQYRVGARVRYLAILKSLNIRPMRWSEIKKAVEIEEKKKINDSHIANYIENLVDYGFIEKEEDYYKLTDPLIRNSLSLVLAKGILSYKWII